MRESEVLEVLEALARKLDIRVRRESFRGEGGLCRVRGEQWIILNRTRTPGEQIEILARTLAPLELDGHFMPPRVRELIEAARRRGPDPRRLV